MIKIILIGDSGVGKTSLLDQYVNGGFNNNHKPTIGADFMKKQVNIGNRNVFLQMWDTAGQERFQALSTAFYRGSHCCILVYDVTSESSFEHLNTWKQTFFRIDGVAEKDSTVTFIVVGNKKDMIEERVVSEQKAKTWCKQNGDMKYFETSSKEENTVDKVFQYLAETAALQLEIQDATTRPIVKVEEKRTNRKQGQEESKCDC
mmetsp:Transcript_4758/g.5158  ORF Transcript_4758/g.5158 Transcript_4758/m.5158 type:complete len:204 (+) Transcript_4758:45-656(+)